MSADATDPLQAVVGDPLQPPFLVRQALALTNADANGVRLSSSAKRFIAVTALLVAFVAAFASIAASVIVCQNHVSRRLPSEKAQDVRVLAKEAIEAAAAARQDGTLGFAVAHANQAVAHLRALELIASPGQIERTLGVDDFSTLAAQIRATHDEVMQRAATICPSLSLV